MAEAKFAVRRRGWEEEEVVLRVAGIVCNAPNPTTKQGGYRWQLDGSNDWWMDMNPWPEDECYDEYIVAHRYASEEVMKGLQTFLLFLFK